LALTTSCARRITTKMIRPRKMDTPLALETWKLFELGASALLKVMMNALVCFCLRARFVGMCLSNYTCEQAHTCQWVFVCCVGSLECVGRPILLIYEIRIGSNVASAMAGRSSTRNVPINTRYEVVSWYVQEVLCLLRSFCNPRGKARPVQPTDCRIPQANKIPGILNDKGKVLRLKVVP
jgi:hypothetical protein